MEESEARTQTLRVPESREAYGRSRGRRIAPSGAARRPVLIAEQPLVGQKLDEAKAGAAATALADLDLVGHRADDGDAEPTLRELAFPVLE
jgi:hypothetical protein